MNEFPTITEIKNEPGKTGFENAYAKIISKYNIKQIVYNYLDYLIKKYVYIQNLFCSMEIKKDYKSRSYEIKEKDKLILLIGVEYLIELELKHPKILKIGKYSFVKSVYFGMIKLVPWLLRLPRSCGYIRVYKLGLFSIG
ncbi:unnamed protein product [Meloidogyne enterolobii]|uniref:Uncharacterized protein n=1 Tax=Meloidogyne enterolobii TaxID=390850 RepID=A0ACB1AWI1_MELEN